MLKWLFGRKREETNEALPSYEESRDIADTGDAERRRWLASQPGLQPEFLYYFASDQDESVRSAVAGNPDTPLQADRILADDHSDKVRAELARKIARLMPELDPDGSDVIAEMVMEIVDVLARDRAVEVRRAVSVGIKRLGSVPDDLALMLARDAEAAVAAPVLEYSPLLNDNQLIEIIRSGIDGGALQAIARRRNLRASVASALVEEEDIEVTKALLDNQSATIEEADMLAIGDLAETEASIEASMIERDDLTLATVRRISSFVSGAIFDRLAEKYRQLGPEIIEDIRRNVQRRILSGAADTKTMSGEDSRERAERLYAEGNLNEDAVVDAIDDGDRLFVIHALALLTGLSWERVRDILASRSAKAVCALSWKAEFTAERAATLQMKVANLQGKAVIRPTPSGNYAMSEDDMAWYLDFFE